MLLSKGAEPRPEYRQVELRIFASADGGASYPVEVQIPGWRSFPTGALRLDPTALAAAAADPRAHGRALGELLFAPGAAGDALKETLAVMEAGGEALRFRLRVDAPALRAVPWERLLAPIDGAWLPLAASADTPFSRQVDAQGWARPGPVTERPLRVLAVIASPAGLDQFGLDAVAAAERQALHTLLDGLPGCAVRYLESGTAAPPTLDALRAALADGPHIVHVLCHGAAADAGAALFLERADGAVARVMADDLLDAVALAGRQPLLWFLAACESAAHGRADAFAPLAPALVERGGAMAALAMADRVGVDTARQFTAQFYGRLLRHGLVDLAANEARALVQGQWDWSVPTLLSRLGDGQLLDFPAGRPVAELGGVAATVGRALETARRQDHGQQLVAGLERILAAFEQSFRGLVRHGSDFRAVGADRATFAEQFQRFYLAFKEYYDLETFNDEQALLREMLRLRADLLPQLRPVLDAAAYQQLDDELQQMAVTRAGLITGFGDYLEPLNAAVDAIKGQLDRGDLDAAIAHKQRFETEISPSLRRSKALLAEIGASIGRVQAA